jgi:N-acetylglucosaminyldiphosphoundecaprenol N-acetyl-beta-D-mannosaminyltransferase
MKRGVVLECPVDLSTTDEVVNKIVDLIDQREPMQVVTLNAEMIYKAQQAERFKQLINNAVLVTADGISVVWALRTLGFKIQERVTGIDLLYKLCERGSQKKWKIFLLGSAPGIAEKAGSVIKQCYPGITICGTHDGYFSDKDNPAIVEQIANCQPDLLFVGMGAPRQEYWIQDNMHTYGVPISIGVGGSFDVVAGEKKRAPLWMIKLNIEWLYRLIIEPSRIKRQLALPKFMLMVLYSKFRKY